MNAVVVVGETIVRAAAACLSVPLFSRTFLRRCISVPEPSKNNSFLSSVRELFINLVHFELNFGAVAA